MIALLEAQRAGLFQRKYWLNNLIAGVTVGVVALPLALAFAIASGVKPEQGLYTAIIAGICVSLLGGSRIQIAGPTGAFIVLLAGIVADHGVDGLLLATLMAGVMLVAFGVARMGAVIRYIPMPVILGFTAGIGVVIFTGQWPDFFGMPTAEGRYFHQKLWFMLQHIKDVDAITIGFGLAALVLVLLPRRVTAMRRIPGPLLALLLTTLVQGVIGFSQVATIGSTFGALPSGLPHFAFPDWSMDKVVVLIGPAFAVAMLGAIESLLSAVVADGMAGTRHHANTELIGQGIANILSPMFGGIAATGAIARTATNIRSGGNSPLAGVIHALTLVLVLLFLAPLARNIPLATLAAVLFVVAWDMSAVRQCLQIVRRAPKADVVILLVTFLLTVFADLVIAVNIGIVLAVLQFLRRMSDSVEVVNQDTAMLSHQLQAWGIERIPEDMAIKEIRGPLFFAGIEGLKQATVAPSIRYLVLRLDLVPFADATALLALGDLSRELRMRDVHLVLTGANQRVAGKLRRMGVLDTLDEGAFVPDIRTALSYYARRRDAE